MWVFTNRGFLSIIQDRETPGNLLVRSRKKAHLEAFFPNHTITETPHRDYRFRVSVTRGTIAEIIRAEVEGIDYPNFKNSIQEDRFHDACSDVWGVMFRFQRGGR